jgi:Ca2+-binding EF-hand superfamily protein
MKKEQLSELISTAINSVDDSLHVEEFAKAVALVMRNDYGTHNYESFINTLKTQLQ